MKTHVQSATMLSFTEAGQYKGIIERPSHYALADTLCPTCQAKPGWPCIMNGRAMPKLAVHVARAEAAL